MKIFYLLILVFLIQIAVNQVNAQNCEIWDVTAEELPCNELGQFYVLLDFEYENVGDEGFHVQGNGNNYGNFWYESLPVEIGPLDGDGLTVYEFVAIDNQYEDCGDWTEIDPVDCNGGECYIWDLVVDDHPCLENHFWVYLDFNFENVGEEGFGVWVNDELLGYHDYDDLPLNELGPFNGDGTTVYHFAVHDLMYDDCGDMVELGPIDCGSTECNIWDLVVDDHPCVENHFWVYLDFNYENIGDEGFGVYVNEELFGYYDYENLPLNELGPFEGNGTTVYHFVVRDLVFETCHDYKALGPIDCTAGECNIWDVTAEVLPCNELEQFYVLLDFEYENVGDEGFRVVGNGNNYGNFEYENLPVEIGPMAGDGITTYEFAAKDNQFELCGGWTAIDPVNCNGDCSIHDLEALALPCNEEDQFNVLIDFEFQNVGEEGFHIHGNGNNYGNYNYDDLPVEIGPFTGDGTIYYEFAVTDNHYEDCHDAVDVGTVNCGEMPEVINLVAEVTDCIGTSYHVNLDFEVQNAGNEGFILTGNHEDYGSFLYEELPLTIGPLETDGVTSYYFMVRDKESIWSGNWDQLLPFDCNTWGEEEMSGVEDHLRIYPNPAEDVLSIEYQNSTDQAVDLVIYNMIGGEVLDLKEIKHDNNKVLVQWNCNNMPDGVYLLRLQTGFEVISRKIILK